MVDLTLSDSDDEASSSHASLVPSASAVPSTTVLKRSSPGPQQQAPSTPSRLYSGQSEITLSDSPILLSPLSSSVTISPVIL